MKTANKIQIDCYKKAIKIKPNIPKTYSTLGDISAKQGLTIEVQEYYAKVA